MTWNTLTATSPDGDDEYLRTRSHPPRLQYQLFRSGLRFLTRPSQRSSPDSISVDGNSPVSNPSPPRYRHDGSSPLPSAWIGALPLGNGMDKTPFGHMILAQGGVTV
ncbi:hypothetical protein CK203_084610 [Vitis vinifera]|uniref:Uncharacterized protein n=1 Tax=Vitis vinifera TaxID=29760 RepID=A0A438DK82_VITVI|nr:hypothetical protein CK203_084610 [Vitis vinifera]